MSFPLKVISAISGYPTPLRRQITLNAGLTVILGPNGSGKTQMLRGMAEDIKQHAAGGKVRFISAGRIGLLETYRSNYDGHRTTGPMYDHATYGSITDSSRRHLTETLSGDFQTLAMRPDIQIKIQERLSKLFRRNFFIEWDGGNLSIKFSRIEVGAKPYSSGREASGLLHVVGILTSLYDDEVGALLIDEPEVSLHPQLQAFLASEIRAAAGLPQAGSTKKLVVIATHSTEMLKIHKPADLAELVFCSDIQADPYQITPQDEVLQGRKVKTLVSRLGQEHKLSLFCKRPLLVEGPSDVIICAAIASQADIYLEASGSQLLPVVGKGQMPVTRKLLKALGKQPVTLVDADAVTDGLELMADVLNNNITADSLASSNGFPTAIRMAQTIYSDFCELVANEWASINEKAERHAYWLNREDGNEALAKKRAAFCTLFLFPEESFVGQTGVSGWASMRVRLSALLDLLEVEGCFVLRRGSIESYYTVADPVASKGKPSEAAVEMEHIDQLTIAQIEGQYGDIVRCLRFASDTAPINEAEAMRNILLSVVAPLLASVHTEFTSDDAARLALSLAGEKAKIFKFEVLPGALKISLESKILVISGFPMTINVGDNLIERVNQSLLLTRA